MNIFDFSETCIIIECFVEFHFFYIVFHVMKSKVRKDGLRSQLRSFRVGNYIIKLIFLFHLLQSDRLRNLVLKRHLKIVIVRNYLFHWGWIIRRLTEIFLIWCIWLSGWYIRFLSWINLQVWSYSKYIIFIIENRLRNAFFSSLINFTHIDDFHLSCFIFKIFVTHSVKLCFILYCCTIWRSSWINLLRRLILNTGFLVYIYWIVRIYISSLFLWKSTEFIIAE